jgi:hypothetical protein
MSDYKTLENDTTENVQLLSTPINALNETSKPDPYDKCDLYFPDTRAVLDAFMSKLMRAEDDE